MTTNTTTHHLTPPSSRIGHRDELAPPTSSRQRVPPSPRAQSKSILTIALQKAQTAVHFDASNNVVAALDAYKQTVELLSEVIDKAANEADRRRLQLIHDTYADRIRLLSTIVPESDNSSDNKDNDENSTSSGQNNDGALTQNSADLSVNTNSANSVGRESIPENDSKTEDVNETTLNSLTIQERDYNESSSLSTQQNVDTKIDNSETERTNANDSIDHHNDIKENMRNDMVDYMTTHTKRSSLLSQRSNTSTSTSKSWISTKSNTSDKTTSVSMYEISVEGTKSTADSSDIGESTHRSSDLDSSSEDIDTTSDTINEYLQNSDSYDANSENIEENNQNQDDPLQQKQEVEKSSSNLSRIVPSRVFVPPPPPKIAPPKTPPITHDEAPSPSTPISISDKSAIIGRKSSSPTILPPLFTVRQPEHGSPSHTIYEDDDNASVKSVPSTFTRSPSPQPKSPVELVSKAIPHSRRPTPLPLVPPNNYNSRNIPGRSPSNPNLLVNPNNSNAIPRRTASNPGNTPKKTSSVRFFNSQSLSHIQTPSSPWMNSFSIISPPLGSPVFGPPTATFRSESSLSSAKTIDGGYASCLLNPFPNMLFYDDDVGLSHMSSNNGLHDPPPNDLHLKPFWLMKLLERTMKTGGYLTPKLFIPQSLWLQGHAKLTAVDAKISSCEVVSNCLARLAKISFDDMDKLAKELEGIDPILEGLQNSLARKLSCVESTNGKGRQSTSSIMNWGSKLTRSLDRMGMGNAMVRTEEASGYVDVLLKVFQQVDVVEKCIIHFTSLKTPLHLHHHKQIIVRLYKFAEFFGSVICRFVIRDLGILTDKYLKKGSHWVVD